MAATTTTFDVGITTLTNVTAISRIAYDIRDMAEALEANDFLTARRIYENGKNAPQYNFLGDEMDEFLSLQKMGKAGIAGSPLADGDRGLFDEDPTFMFQMLGMANIGEPLSEVISKHAAYADAYITQELNDKKAGTLGAQSAAILIVSQYATHQLWDGLQDCYAVQQGWNPEADKTGKINPKQSFDNFIALYIGAGQTLAPDWEGDMLYELAQAGGDMFGTQNREGEANVNTEIKQLYQNIQQIMSERDFCKRDESIESLWGLVNKIIAKMYVPMVQLLIHSMYDDQQYQKVRMYALAVVPQLSQCRPSIQRALKSYLLDKQYDRVDMPRIVSLLQQSYDCLGFTCSDIGTYGDNKVAECAAIVRNHPIAGFVPKEPVQALSKIDLDILAIEQLFKFPSTTYNYMAQLYYKYGKAAALDDTGSAISLQHMARSPDDEKWSPYYSEYLSYYEEDYYADTRITTAFRDRQNVLKLSDEQRGAYIVSTIQYNVVLQYLMGLVGAAVQACEEAKVDDKAGRASGLEKWDSFAAIYIGSLEGTKSQGSELIDGLMIWNLANKRSVSFNTQNGDFYAKINDEMIDLLFAGQSEVSRSDCTNFEKTTTRAMHLMLLPFIQSTIWYAIKNANLKSESTSEDLAIGEVLAFSILPIVQKYDRNAEATIERNMARAPPGSSQVFEGPQAVADACFLVLQKLGWGCDLIGSAEGVRGCDFNTLARSSGYSRSRYFNTLLSTIVVAWFYIAR